MTPAAEYTSDEAGLMGAILAVPEDDGPRLVYADWLDENGQPEQAEFVRVQCELARLPWVSHFDPHVAGPGGKQPADPTRYDALRRRAADLLQQAPGELPNWFTWAGFASYSEIPVGMRWEWSRGFVAAVSFPTITFVGGPCGRCRGTLVDVDHTRRRPITGACPTCKGDPAFRTVGLAAELARRHPLTEVRLTDREPWAWEPASFTPPVRFSWINEDEQSGIGDEERQRAHVPGALFAELTRLPGAEIRFREYARYDSADAAHAALSAACVAYGRRLAGPAPASAVGP